jgi:hypothetical protein
MSLSRDYYKQSRVKPSNPERIKLEKEKTDPPRCTSNNVASHLGALLLASIR